MILVVLASCATTKYTKNYCIKYGDRNYYVNEYRVENDKVFFTEYRRDGKNVRGEQFVPVADVTIVESTRNK